MPKPLDIIVRAKDEASAALGEISGAVAGVGISAKQAGIALVGFGAAVTGGLALGVKAAADEQVGINALTASLAKVGIAYTDVRQELDASLLATQRKTNFGDEEQRAVLTTLVPILGDYEKAMAALPAILDASAFSGANAATVARTMSRALDGQVNTAITVGIAFDKTADFGERLATVLEKVGGQAEAQANPFKQFANALEDAAQAAGAPLLKPLTAVLEVMTNWFLALQNVNPALLTTLSIGAALVGVFATFAGTLLLLLPTLKAGLAILKSMAAVMAVLRALTGPTGIAIAAAAIGVGLATQAAVKTFGEGGIVTRPTLGIIGDQGPEAIIPLSRAGGGLAPALAGVGAGGGRIDLHIHGGPLLLTDERALDQFARMMTERARRGSLGTTGRLP